jgi:arginyl-tRNA synthetase
MSILADLKAGFRNALAGLSDSPDELLDLIRTSQDPKFGDYQANLAMPLGKRLRKPPRQVAQEIVDRIDLAAVCQSTEIAGPGFINLRLRDEYLAARLEAAVGDPRLGIAPVARPRTYVVDYSAPNVAKEMHVGHIRSTVIGDALGRTLRFLGHKAISDNHIGDWGTQFGMIIYGWRHFRDEAAYRENPVRELGRLYRLVRRLVDVYETDDAEKRQRELADPEIGPLAAAHPQIGTAVLEETAKLHAGDEENLRLWREFLPHCEADIERIYDRLGVRFDHTLGESFYQPMLGPLVEDLLRTGVARPSEGAICIFLEGHETPMLVRKQDGAFLYATTDLATLRYRMETWHPDAVLYVVDHRQSLHFKLLFQAARLVGYAHPDTQLMHVSFGTVLGEDGRPFKTRAGDTVSLEGLLDEAVRRAARIVAENDDAKPDGAELSAEQRARIAETVGIAALKYADLSQNRTSDYVFSYDKMLAMNGNTATYMQYAYARVRSIFAKGRIDVEQLRAAGHSIVLGSAPERALALELLRFEEALDLVLSDYRPNQLTAYLFDLANRYSTFFEQCPVLRADTDAERTSRLLLCDLTARTIRCGLELLGIDVVDKM